MSAAASAGAMAKPAWNDFWPDLSDPDSARKTVQLGACILVWLAASSAFGAAWIAFTGEPLYSSRDGGFADEYDRYSALASDTVLAILGAPARAAVISDSM